MAHGTSLIFSFSEFNAGRKTALRESVQSFTEAVEKKVPGFFDRASANTDFVMLEPEDVEYAPEGEFHKCETNAFLKCKSDPDRYLPVGGYLFERDFPIEHWWVYDSKLKRHLEVTPMKGPAEDVTGYCGIINRDLADEIREARSVWDVEFFRGGNVYSKYFK